MAADKSGKTTFPQLPKMIFIEPFYGGSHKALIDTLVSSAIDYELVTLPAKKWHWRARCGALMLHDLIPDITSEKILFCSSVLNLAELLGVKPELQLLKKIVYFHENQLIYPVRKIKERDIQYAYNQIMSCLAADVILFNSCFNKTTFLDNIKKVVKMLPDCKPQELKVKIEPKCKVLYFPIQFPKTVSSNRSSDCLHLVWPHRWEFDKGPEDFFSVLFKLKDNRVPFRLSILGESFTDNPPIFSIARDKLKDETIHFGYVSNKEEYFKILKSAHLVVSTAKHEFFGVAMLEAVYCGCYPLAPNALVYPEIYPADCLFSDVEELYNRLKDFCSSPSSTVDCRMKLNIDFNKYASHKIASDFVKIVHNL